MYLFSFYEFQFGYMNYVVIWSYRAEFIGTINRIIIISRPNGSNNSKINRQTDRKKETLTQ